MRKELQVFLVWTVFLSASIIRLSISGWLFPIGVASVVIVGAIHFVTHYFSLKSLSQIGIKNILLISLSHLFFLGTVTFQTEADDRKSYSVLGEAFGFENEFLEENGFDLVGVCLVGYVIVTIIILINRKIKNPTSSKQKNNSLDEHLLDSPKP